MPAAHQSSSPNTLTPNPSAGPTNHAVTRATGVLPNARQTNATPGNAIHAAAATRITTYGVGRMTRSSKARKHAKPHRGHCSTRYDIAQIIDRLHAGA